MLIIINIIIEEMYKLTSNLIQFNIDVMITSIYKYLSTKKELSKIPSNSQSKNSVESNNLGLNLNFVFLFLFDLDKKLVEFICIWPPYQWVTSLLSLVLMYWFVGRWYNKRLEKEGGWISAKARILMIFFDLFINLCIGLYYMDYRETIMGVLMMRCPISISPLIFVLEFLVFVIYYRKYVLPKAKHKQKVETSFKVNEDKDSKVKSKEGIISETKVKKNSVLLLCLFFLQGYSPSTVILILIYFAVFVNGEFFSYWRARFVLFWFY